MPEIAFNNPTAIVAAQLQRAVYRLRERERMHEGRENAPTFRPDLPAFHPGQSEIVANARRFNTLACGRRFGKSLLGIEQACDTLLKGFPVGWFSPTHKMLTSVWREFERVLKPVTRRANISEHRLELVGGGILDMWSLDSADTVRGRPYKRVLIDEAAMVAKLQEAWQNIIRPTLTDFIGDAWFLSTPRGLDFFYELFQMGQDPLKLDWASWQMPTAANPFIDPQEIQAAKDELPAAVFDQEYLALFLSNQGAVFRNIDACLHAPQDAQPEAHKGHDKFLGGDWGQKNDFTALSVLCATCNQELELDRFNKIEWALQRERLKLLIEKWEVTQALLESNSIGGPNLEALINEGLPVRGFETTATSKRPLIQGLVLALERAEIQWLPDVIARYELIRFESKVSTATGHISYSAPEGSHDDTVLARALARKAAAEGNFKLDIIF